MVESVGMSSDNCRPVCTSLERDTQFRASTIGNHTRLTELLAFLPMLSIVRPHACGCLRLRRARSTIHSSNMAHLIIITSVDKRAKSVGICTCKFGYISFALRQLPFPQQVTSQQLPAIMSPSAMNEINDQKIVSDISLPD